MIVDFTKQRLYKVFQWVTDGNSEAWTPDKEPNPMVNLEETASLDEADIITSLPRQGIPGFQRKHMVMFDVDVPMVVYPSSTEGHSHVYFPTNHVSDDDLFKLLDALADAGIVERGYAKASRARGFAALRPPWLRKRVRPRFKRSEPVLTSGGN